MHAYNLELPLVVRYRLGDDIRAIPNLSADTMIPQQVVMDIIRVFLYGNKYAILSLPNNRIS